MFYVWLNPAVLSCWGWIEEFSQQFPVPPTLMSDIPLLLFDAKENNLIFYLKYLIKPKKMYGIVCAKSSLIRLQPQLDFNACFFMGMGTS